MKKIVLSGIAFALLVSNSVFAAGSYKEISCSSDPIFTQNSCSQCFDGGMVSEGKNLGLLSDVWSNGTSKAMYFIKEENSLEDAAKMISLNGAAWSYEPTKNGFWEYTNSLESLDHEEGFYKLDSGKSIDWIQSKLGYSIKLNKSVDSGKNIGLLKYIINVHIDEGGVPSETTTTHSECVLFKSSGEKEVETPIKPNPVKVNPTSVKTGPEEVLLFILSLFLAGGLFYFSRRKAS